MALSDTNHFLLLAQARWHVLRNSLNRGYKRFELLFRILTWLGAATGTIAMGVAQGLGGFYLFPKRPLFLGIVLWVMFMMWQFGPLLMDGATPTLNFREIARYPIRFRMFFWLSAAYGLLEPAALICIAWLGFLWTGITLGHPEYGARTAWLFLLFITVNLFLNRVMFGWLARLMATRRGREFIGAAALLLALAAQVLIYGVLPRVEKTHKTELTATMAAINRYSPPGLIYEGLTKVPSQTQRSTFMLLAIDVALLWLMRRQLRAIYLGDMDSESSVITGAIQVRPGWKLPFASDQLSAMVEKELRTLGRQTIILVNIVSAWFFVLVMAVGPDLFKRAFLLSEQSRTNNLYPMALAYSFLVLSNMPFNCFWSDSGGFYRWLLSPISMRRLLQAKNLAFSVVVVINVAVITAIVSLGVTIGVMDSLMAMMGVVYFMLFFLGIGNMFSGWFPKRVEPGKMQKRNVSEAAAMLGLLAQAILAGIWFSLIWAARYWGHPWYGVGGFALLILMGGAFYWFSLEYAARYLTSHTDKLTTELA